MNNRPRLFGINKSNRDYSKADTWGKNQFNSSFPASLGCFLHAKGMKAVYYKAKSNMDIELSYIGIDELYGLNPLGEEIYFSFETQYTTYQKYVIGSIPRNDLVILNNGQCISSLEVKLVALPDNSTCNLSEDEYGSEIVVRPDTIVYLACSIIESCRDDRRDLKLLLGKDGEEIEDWSNPAELLQHICGISDAIKRIVRANVSNQKPIIMEPIWKTEGKSSQLADNCLDVFVWSNLGMLSLFMPSEPENVHAITRHTRTMIWLYKMLFDYANNCRFNGEQIIDELSYNLKNDKAFSSNGLRTHKIMKCKELLKPRIMKSEIKNIILGGGQNLLSPERRFDVIIYNSPDLFKEEQ